MPCDQYVINGPPNGPVLFCSPASAGVYRLFLSVPLPAGRPCGWSGGRHSTAGQYCYVPLARHLMQKLGEGWAKLSRCVIEFDQGPNMWYNLYDALRDSLGD